MEDETEDFKEWGDAWVYCNQHLRPHKTGWCAVGLRNKICVCAGHRDESEAYQKCRDMGLKLFSPNNPVTDAEHLTPANTRAQGPRSV